MRLEIYLKRQRTTIDSIVNLIGAESYADLAQHLNAIGIKCPPKENLNYEFKKDVEERPAIKSSAKKKRVSNKKSSKPKTNDSAGSGGSGSRQRVRKSPAKRQRKRKSNNDESVQLTSGSEDTK
jgi:hypothetical protein